MSGASGVTPAQARGRFGEDLAARWYVRNGYEVLDRNWRCAHGEIEILGQRIIRPAASVLHCRAPPDAAGSIELEQPASQCAAALLDKIMTILHQPLRPRQPVGAIVLEFAA